MTGVYFLPLLFYRSEMRMKLMTLNTHSLVEPSYKEKKEKFIEVLAGSESDSRSRNDSGCDVAGI